MTYTYDAPGAGAGRGPWSFRLLHGRLGEPPAPAGFQTSPSLACDDSGNVIAAWERGADIVARRFDRFLSPLSSVFAVPPTGSGLRTRPRVGSSGSGDFVVAWEAWSQDAGGPGFVVVFPGDAEMPVASNVNFSAAMTRANNAILALARNGAGTLGARASVAGSGTVHLVLDVNGYFE